MVVEVPVENGRVPTALPPILKNYTKAAIRTQPGELISWSYAYFDSLLQGDSPPVKEQIEYPLPQSVNGITPGLLKVLHRKLGPMGMVPRHQFEDLCQAMGVRDLAMSESWDAAGGGAELSWDDLLINLVSKETKSPQEQLAFIMQSVTEEPTTKAVGIETALKYFDLIHKSDDEEVMKLHEEVKEYLSDVASYQDSNLFPSDLSRPSCPLSKLSTDSD